MDILRSMLSKGAGTNGLGPNILLRKSKVISFLLLPHTYIHVIHVPLMRGLALESLVFFKM